VVVREIPTPGRSIPAKRHRDRLHDPVGFGQDFKDALVMFHVIEAEGAALPVLQPFLGGLVAADGL